MRHKLLLVMQDMLSSSPVVLGKVSELDETYVLESFKGKKLLEVYRSHLEDGTLLLCDGLKSLAECTIKDINTASPAEVNFYHLNTVNNFHSFIKDRYDYYRGVATKYLNRYNALFSLVWRCNTALVTDLCSKLFHSGSVDYYHSIKDIKTLRLLVL